jgi:hypothetical protein
VRDGSLRRLAFAHALSAVGEWAVTVGVLVHAFAWGGSGAVGIVSLAVLVPPFAFAPLVGAAMGRWRPFAIRSVAVAIQVVAYGVAATLAVTGAATPALAPLVVVGLAATTTMHPTGAALLPRVARSTDELVGANLWITHSDSASALAGSLVAGSLVGAGGPEAVFAAGASLAAAGLLATRWRPAQLARIYRVSATTTTGKVVRDALAELRARPWSKGVLGAASARNLVVGAYDVLLVVVALEALGLDQEALVTSARWSGQARWPARSSPGSWYVAPACEGPSWPRSAGRRQARSCWRCGPMRRWCTAPCRSWGPPLR